MSTDRHKKPATSSEAAVEATVGEMIKRADRRDELALLRVEVHAAAERAAAAERFAHEARAVAEAAQKRLDALEPRVTKVEEVQSGIHLDVEGLKKHAYGAGAVGGAGAGAGFGGVMAILYGAYELAKAAGWLK